METQKQIMDLKEGTLFWELQWSTVLPNSITFEQWLEIQKYIDEKTIDFITEPNEKRIINK